MKIVKIDLCVILNLLQFGILYLDYMKQLGCFYYKLEENTCNASCKNTQRYVQ